MSKSFYLVTRTVTEYLRVQAGDEDDAIEQAGESDEVWQVSDVSLDAEEDPIQGEDSGIHIVCVRVRPGPRLPGEFQARGFSLERARELSARSHRSWMARHESARSTTPGWEFWEALYGAASDQGVRQ